MRQLVWSKTFVRAYKKAVQQHPDLRTDIEQVLRLLAQDPFDARLRTHKLKGKLSGVWACSVSYDLRLVFEFMKSANQEDEILLVEIGTHEEVY